MSRVHQNDHPLNREAQRQDNLNTNSSAQEKIRKYIYTSISSELVNCIDWPKIASRIFLLQTIRCHFCFSLQCALNLPSYSVFLKEGPPLHLSYQWQAFLRALVLEAVHTENSYIILYCSLLLPIWSRLQTHTYATCIATIADYGLSLETFPWTFDRYWQYNLSQLKSPKTTQDEFTSFQCKKPVSIQLHFRITKKLQTDCDSPPLHIPGSARVTDQI